MLFNSLEFIIFFFAIILVYYALPRNNYRKIFLLGASYYFYSCWNFAFLSILLFETLLSYAYGRNLKRLQTKGWLACFVILALLPLSLFKYLNFALGTIHDLWKMMGCSINVPEFQLLLPVGISFYTFMAVGYMIDMYKGKYQPEKNLLDYSLFIGFFPQIASGPIGRGNQLIPQFKAKRDLLYENVSSGLKMMIWGFFMKLVVGDRAGIYVDTVFGNYMHHNGASLMLATFMYTIQIYCDFAGYSLIAIGVAKSMGYNLMENFRRPYFATSVADFWRRWHISLSTWFRDYVYIPCGGSRVGTLKLYRNLMITFLVSGLWHGAAYNFIFWGGYHAVNQILAKMFKPNKDKVRQILRIGDTSNFRRIFDIVFTFVLVSYGWMIFYAPDMNFVVSVTKGYLHLGSPYIHQTTLFFFAIGLLILFVHDLRDEYQSTKDASKSISLAIHCVNYVKYAVLVILIVWMGVLGGGQFIYFQF
jgi:D-alanyl-lipoteichoic acid acyltransferase DltB (MBOAT superfamily)